METLESFREHCAQLPDEELYALVFRGADLTQEARRAVFEEFKRRQMADAERALGTAWTSTLILPRYRPAPHGARLRAFLVDFLIAILPFFLSIAVLDTTWKYPPLWAQYLLFGAASAWSIGYMFAKDGRAHGQSIGKNMYGLMVVNVDTNQPCSMREAIRRQVELFFLLLLPMVGWLIEPAVVVLSTDGRRLGDRAAHTQVIAVEDYVAGGPIEIG